MLLTGPVSFESQLVNFDAVGSDSSNPKASDRRDQYRLKGADLRDWRLRYKTGTFYDFNDSVIVSAGDTIRIFIGSGTNTATELYWGNSSGILAHSAGDVTLQSNYRVDVDRFEWPADVSGQKYSIVIDDVQYDAPGSDSANPNGEWVKIRNAGHVTADLTGWRLKDSSVDYTFSSGETLAPGERLTIYVGAGTDNGSDRYWGNSSGILSNGGEKLRLWTGESWRLMPMRGGVR